MRSLLIALLLFGMAGCAEAQPPFAKIEKYTGRLDLPDGSVCSGTRFHEAIITSKHCMSDQPKQVRFQGILVNVTRTWVHGENVYVYTDRNWGPGPKFGKAKKGDTLYIIGNAGGFEQIARTATLSAFTDKALPKVKALLIACGNCWHGDSGAGVFNAHGELVAVYLGGYSLYVIEQQGTPGESLSVFSLSIAVPVT